MTSNRPYLIRALYQWMVDNEITPHLLVNAEDEQVKVPTEFIKDGRIILNIHPSAVANLHIENDWISFNARFSGVSRELWIPPRAVQGIFAKENGQGMVFPEETGPSPAEPGEPDKPTPGGKTPGLKLVK